MDERAQLLEQDQPVVTHTSPTRDRSRGRSFTRSTDHPLQGLDSNVDTSPPKSVPVLPPPPTSPSDRENQHENRQEPRRSRSRSPLKIRDRVANFFRPHEEPKQLAEPETIEYDFLKDGLGFEQPPYRFSHTTYFGNPPPQPSEHDDKEEDFEESELGLMNLESLLNTINNDMGRGAYAEEVMDEPIPSLLPLSRIVLHLYPDQTEMFLQQRAALKKNKNVLLWNRWRVWKEEYEEIPLPKSVWNEDTRVNDKVLLHRSLLAFREFMSDVDEKGKFGVSIFRDGLMPQLFIPRDDDRVLSPTLGPSSENIVALIRFPIPTARAYPFWKNLLRFFVEDKTVIDYSSDQVLAKLCIGGMGLQRGKKHPSKVTVSLMISNYSISTDSVDVSLAREIGQMVHEADLNSYSLVAQERSIFETSLGKFRLFPIGAEPLIPRDMRQ